VGRNVENLRKNIENKVIRLNERGIKFRKVNVTNGNVDLILKFDLEHSQKMKVYKDLKLKENKGGQKKW
jgi:hypothetical protein